MKNKKRVDSKCLVSFCLGVLMFIIAVGSMFAVDNNFVFAEEPASSSNWLSENCSFVSGFKIEERSAGDAVSKFLVIEIDVKDNYYLENFISSEPFVLTGIEIYDSSVVSGSNSNAKQFLYMQVLNTGTSGFSLAYVNSNKIYLYFGVPGDFFSLHAVSNLGLKIKFGHKILLENGETGYDFFGSFKVACNVEYLYNLGLACGSSDGDLYQQGFDVGYAKGVEYGENNKSFSELIFSIVDAPFNVLKNAFDFEILGYNIGSLLTAVVSLILLGFVIKLLI